MGNENDLNPFTLSSLFLNLRLVHEGQENCVGKATGFLWKHEKDLYLITNWHVVTGKDQITKEPLKGASGRAPNRMEINFPACDSKFNLDLYNSDGYENWIEHPNGSQVDVVAIPVKQINADLPVIPLNTLFSFKDNVILEVGMDVKRLLTEILS